MTFEEFEAEVDAAVRGLPRRYRDILDEQGIVVLPRRRMPRPLKGKGTVFGVFVGVPHGRFVDLQTEPTRIELYQESFERSFSGPDEIREEIRRTVIHEVAHYFGFSEKQIRKLGY